MSGNLPRHGSRVRYRAPWLCRCVNCVGRTTLPDGENIRWPFRLLETRVSLERLRMWFEEEEIAEWRKEGLSDSTADKVAVTLGMMPTEIWGHGYTTAGIDYQEYR